MPRFNRDCHLRNSIKPHILAGPAASFKVLHGPWSKLHRLQYWYRGFCGQQKARSTLLEGLIIIGQVLSRVLVRVFLCVCVPNLVSLGQTLDCWQFVVSIYPRTAHFCVIQVCWHTTRCALQTNSYLIKFLEHVSLRGKCLDLGFQPTWGVRCSPLSFCTGVICKQ